jgi:DNA-binding CsgD family transcriptional regulator
VSDIDLSDLIGLIYEAPLAAAAGWTLALEHLARVFRASTACFVRQDVETHEGMATTWGTDPSFHASYFDHYARINVLWDGLGATAAGSTFTERDVPGRAAFLRSEFYNDWLRPQDACATLACKLEGPVGAAAATVVSIQHPHRIGEFEDEEFRLFHCLVPHLRRAARLDSRLAEVARQSLLESTDGRDGIILLGASATVHAANRRGEEILGRADGLITEQRRLAAARPTETAALRMLVAQAAQPDGTGGGLSVPRPSGRLPLHVQVMPLRGAAASWVLGQKPAALAVVTDPEEARLPSAGQLQRQFGLTRTEAAVAVELAKGDAPAEVADRLGMARTTVRTHLAKILAKTRTHRQAQLVRVLLTACPGLADRKG